MRHTPFSLILALQLAAALTAPAQAQVFITPDVRAAFIHTASADSSTTAVPVELASIGVAPGDYLRIRSVGAFDCGPCPDNNRTTMAAFSSTAEILAPALLNRLPGAIDTGVEFISANTFYGNQPTDIPEDFLVYGVSQNITEVRIRVPAAAAYLFITPHDSLYEDNSDPDGDHRYELTVICAGDFNLDGSVDFFDVQAFLAAFAAANPIGDTNADGLYDFFDVQTFLAAFAAGC